MDNISFNTYIITDDNTPIEKQLFHLKKLKTYKYKNDLAIQIRFNKQSDDNVSFFIEELLKENLGIKLIVNNRIDLMNKYKLDGVHFKDNDTYKKIDLKKYKNKIFIKSTHSIDSIIDAEKFNLDAVTYGPIFDTPSKRKFGKPNGYELIKTNYSKLNIPVFALGGINLDNIKELKAYFTGIAAIRLFINENIIDNLNKRREIWK